MVVDVAVEHFRPKSRGGETEIVTLPRTFRERRDDDDVLSGALEPAVISEHAIAIGLVECVDVVASQRGQVSPQMDQVAREAQMIAHRPIVTESPPRQQVRTVRQNVPWHLLEEFLTHEEVGNARRSQQQRGGDPAAAARIPRAGMEESASTGIRGLRPVRTRSWFSMQVTARHAWSKVGG